MPCFHETIAPHVSLLVPTMYWDRRFPRLLSTDQLQSLRASGNKRLLAVADLPCDVDGAVERTKSRPLAAKELSVQEATAFLAVQLTCGLGVLTQLDLDSILLGACSVPLVLSYPLAKRFFAMPQLVLGLTFNWGALLGYSAATGGTVDYGVCLPLSLIHI